MEPKDRFDTLYDRHRVALGAYCRRRVARDVVDDVMAEVSPTFRGHFHPSAEKSRWFAEQANSDHGESHPGRRRMATPARWNSRRTVALPPTLDAVVIVARELP